MALGSLQRIVSMMVVLFCFGFALFAFRTGERVAVGIGVAALVVACLVVASLIRGNYHVRGLNGQH